MSKLRKNIIKYDSDNDTDAILGKWKEFTVNASTEDIHPAVIEYDQDVEYIKDSLVYVGNKIARASKNFISDTVKTTIDESFDTDIANGNLVLITSEENSKSCRIFKILIILQIH